MNRSKPKIMAPVNSLEGASRVIPAGADEVYCGVALPTKYRSFILYRGPGKSSAQLPSYSELEKIVKYAHDEGVKVIVVVNEPFMSDKLEKEMKNHVASIVEKEVDGLIIGDVGVLSVVKEMGVDVQLIASTYFVSMNSETVEFLRGLGFSRVVLERHLTLDEISEIVRNSKVDIEVFCYYGGCSNINGNCYLYHFGTTKFWKASSELKTMSSGGRFVPALTPCRFVYDIYDVNTKSYLGRWPIMDAFTICSLCHLPALIRTGVAGLKIVGRFLDVLKQETATRVIRTLLDKIWSEGGRLKRKSFHKMLSELRRDLNYAFGPLSLIRQKASKERRRVQLETSRLKNLHRFYQDTFCKPQRCFFAPLLNAPYKYEPSIVKSRVRS